MSDQDRTDAGGMEGQQSGAGYGDGGGLDQDAELEQGVHEDERDDPAHAPKREATDRPGAQGTDS